MAPQWPHISRLGAEIGAEDASPETTSQPRHCNTSLLVGRFLLLRFFRGWHRNIKRAGIRCLRGILGTLQCRREYESDMPSVYYVRVGKRGDEITRAASCREARRFPLSFVVSLSEIKSPGRRPCK